MPIQTSRRAAHDASTDRHGEPDRPPAVEAVRALARAARMLERASSELGMAHYRVLSAIAGGEERASRVAERLELGRPTISAAVDALCRGGMLTRVEVERDQRAVDLRLTPAGSELLDRVESKMVHRLADLCARIPEGAELLGALASLGAALDERDTERLRRDATTASRDGASASPRAPKQ